MQRRISNYTHRGIYLHLQKVQLQTPLLPVKIQNRKISSFTNQNREEINIAEKQSIVRRNYI